MPEQHTCSSACTETLDPWLPYLHPDPPERGSEGWVRQATPREKFELEFDKALAATARRAARLIVEALRPDLVELIRETLAQDLPDALAALRRKRR